MNSGKLGHYPVSLGLGETAGYTYDPNTGRMSNYTFTVGSPAKSLVGGLTWNANGTLRTLGITDGFNSGGTQTCNYGTSAVAKYDDLGRLISANCGTPWSQTFSYDAFGNITKSGSTSWMPGYNQATNRYTLGGTSYDANGNLLTDTFHTYGWNIDNHAAKIDSTACGTNGTCLTYDALGRVVERSFNSTYMELMYSPLGFAWQWSSDKLGFVYTGAAEESVATVSNGVGVVETTADFVEGTPSAQAQIRQFLRSEGVKVSMKHVSKDAAQLGKVAGAFGKVLAAKSAYDRYQKCRGN